MHVPAALTALVRVAVPCRVIGAAVLRMLDTFLKSPIPLGYAQRIAAGDYSAQAGFAVDLALKDVG